MLENIRFNLSLKAVTVNRSEQNEVDSYNNLYRNYNKLIYPTKDKTLKDEARRMFSPWKKFFEDDSIVEVRDIEPMLSPKKTIEDERPKPKNLSKLSSSLLIPKKDPNG